MIGKIKKGSGFKGCAPYVSDAKYAFPDKGSELFFFLYIQVFPILLMFRQENWKESP